MSKRGEMSKFDQNPGLCGAARARTTSFKINRSAKRGYSEGFKFSRAIKHELAQTAHLKSTPKGRVPCATKSRCNEARCENTPPKHTQRTQKNPPKRCELRAIKILPQRHVENTAQFRYKDRCDELKCHAQQAVNSVAEQSLRYEFKFSRAMNRVAAQARYARQTEEILLQRYVRQKIEIPSQQYARRSMRQIAEISPRQYAQQTVITLQNRSLPRAAKIPSFWRTQGAEIAKASAQTTKILLLWHTPQGEISRAENCENSAAMRHAASRRNFIEAARMTSHQISAKNRTISAESRKIPNESCREIPDERGAAQ